MQAPRTVGSRSHAAFALALALGACAGSPKPPPQTAVAVAPLPPPPPPLPPPQESLRELVPERAVAALIIRRNALDPLRGLFFDDRALRDELGGYLQRTVGVDLTQVQGVVVFATALPSEGGPPRGAAILRVPGTLAAKLSFGDASAALPPHLGVPLARVDGQLVAAALPGTVLLGDADAVREAIAVQQHLASSLTSGGQAPLAPLLSGDPKRFDSAQRSGAPFVDIELALSGAGLAGEAGAGLARFGVHGAVLRFESDPQGAGRLSLEVHGDNAKLTVAKGLLMALVDAGIKEAEGKKEAAKQSGDVARATGAIVGYHYARRLADELTPRIEGDRLLVTYRLPPQLRGGLIPAAGILAAIAIPSFQKYIEKSRAAPAKRPGL